MLVGLLAAATLGGAADPRPAFQAPLADQALLVDMVNTGDRLVAVGDRGDVLYSDDAQTWTQAEVPVQALLTAVDSSDGELWAVGHDASVIHSADQGQTWTLQHFQPDWERPLLDVHFFDASHGLAIGAYGLVLVTRDGGAHWEEHDMADLVTSEAIDWAQLAEEPEAPAEDAIGDDALAVPEDDEYYDAAQDFDRGCYEFMECHLNALVELDDGRLLIAGERGYGFRSTDRGESWESFRFDYVGSMFGVVQTGDCLIAFGLRGHVQRSCDFGDSWESLETGTQSTLMGGTVQPDGSVVMVGANGDIVELAADGAINHRSHRHGGDLAAVIAGPDGLIVVGEDGVYSE